MDPTHPYFPDGLNMLNDDFDLSGPAETVAGPSGSGATPTSRTKSKRLTSDVWQCFDVVELTLPDETYGITHRILSITLDNASANTKSIALFTERNIPWNSTYLMLKNCSEYDTTISGFYNMKLAESGCPPAQSLTPDDWEDDMLGPAVVAMETKFKKYWSEMPFLYALGVIVDSRIKLAGLEYLLEFIGNKLSVDYSDQITDIRNKLFEVFSIYERRFGGVDTEPSPEPDTQPLPTSWSILKYWKKDKSAISSSSTTRSAASSEQAFSTSGRIIEPRRNCLTPEMVEVLICVRDWEHARKRIPNETVDEQFIQNFSNLYVDDGSGSNQVQN
ncbi:hypothetical protein Dsin_028460 [Dipteronia sinensis]|uniref:Transposase n=1 Tax=Dipteronia sinensis TaxID=43782 RepID=A0AAD9ZQX0_9ROSI|nr:hypothetical protein Dsin_028460 [Dipteronia sinensis]